MHLLKSIYCLAGLLRMERNLWKLKFWSAVQGGPEIEEILDVTLVCIHSRIHVSAAIRKY